MARQEEKTTVRKHVEVTYERRGQTTLWDVARVGPPTDPDVGEPWRGAGAHADGAWGKSFRVMVGLEVDPEEDPLSIIAEAERLAAEFFKARHPGAFIAP